jgi:DNA-directed RNA polymerase subunit M/transcription elongation factor TFIIS
MDAFDPAGQEFLRISERYRQMSDEEIRVLMPQSSDLTPFAQQALATEVRTRGLKAEAESEKPSAPWDYKPPTRFTREAPKFRNSAPSDSSSSEAESEGESSDDAESAYDEDRKLVELCTVYSVRDALQVQSILDARGIPFFMGPEKATGVDAVTSDFSKGVAVQIMQIGLPWAAPGMRHYEPEDDPNPTDGAELEELPVRCPQCHSEEVVLEELASATDESSQKYKWTCDSCGHHWEDDGVAKG